MVTADCGTATRERWRAALRSFPRRAACGAKLRHSAVAIAVVAGSGGEAAFLLTRRSTRLRNHPGQYALPGGALDPGESAAVAARRELREELGVESTSDDVIGEMDDYVTRSGFVITPVVLWLADRAHNIRPEHDEVDELYTVPVAEVGVEPIFVQIAESPRPVIRLPLLGRFVHAPTAAILHQFAELVVHGRVTRVAEYEQPVFAWQ